MLCQLLHELHGRICRLFGKCGYILIQSHLENDEAIVGMPFAHALNQVDFVGPMLCRMRMRPMRLGKQGLDGTVIPHRKR